MKKKIIIFSSIGGAILIGLTVLILCLCLSKLDKSYRTIKVFKVDGVVNVVRDNKSQTASKDMKLKNNDVVEVKEKSSTVLKLDNDKFVMAKENTTLRLIATGKENNTKTRILVDKGGVIVEVKEKLKDSESFEIASSNSVMAIRGTQVSFDVEVKDNKITTSFAILEGNTEILLFKNEKLSSTTLTKDFRMSYTTDVTEVISTEDISKLIDKVGKTVDIINDNDLKEVFNAVKEELTSEEIDSIVDAINDFEREEKVNGVIKFTNDVSKLQYGDDPKTAFIPDKTYNGIKYYYSETIDGDYTLFDSNTLLNVGTSWYFKAISEDAYRSDPFLVEIEQKQLNLSINLSQTIHAQSASSADVIVSIADDEFFNSQDAMELDENMQPLNYIVCKVKHFTDDKYYYGELSYRNKEIVFDRSIFALNYERNDVVPTVEFEYHFADNYNVTNPTSQEYEFVDQFLIDNVIVYYDYITGHYHLQLERGSFGSKDTITDEDVSYFNEYLCVFFSESITDRDDLVDNNEQTYEFDLTDYAHEVDGKFDMTIQARIGSGDYFGDVIYEKALSVDTNILASQVVDHPTGYSRPYINVGSYLYTLNNDGTINIYLDLQNGLEMYEDPNGELALNDYLVRYNTKDGIGSDKYVRGSGRFLTLENVPFDDYVIKDVFAVSKVKDDITYALAHEENDKQIDILSSIVTLNDPQSSDYGIANSMTIEPMNFVGDEFELISSRGVETYPTETTDTDNFYKDDYYVIVKANMLLSMYADDFESLIQNPNYTDENIVSLDEANLTVLKNFMKEKYSIDVKGYTEGEFAFKVYFKVVGETL
ncbi:MAG: FecR family protein [bacterium]|nr:FecR family protein [bacterium]